jgi:hypothetical protein
MMTLMAHGQILPRRDARSPRLSTSRGPPLAWLGLDEMYVVEAQMQEHV